MGGDKAGQFAIARSPAVPDGTGRPRQDGVTPLPTATPSAARRQLDDMLSDHGWSATARYDAALVLSELVTNAIRHGDGLREATASLVDHEVELTVRDRSATLPSLRPPGGEGGLGLHVVGQIASSLTWRLTGEGKEVVATVPRGTAGPPRRPPARE